VCTHICECYLGPYEEARASLYKKVKTPVPERKEIEKPRVNHVKFSMPPLTTASDLRQLGPHTDRRGDAKAIAEYADDDADPSAPIAPSCAVLRGEARLSPYST